MMEIITLPIESLTMHKGNAKLHPQEQIDQIKESIKLYGFNDPIGIWGKKNTIVEGHGRYMAAKEMGLMEVPCIRLDHLSDKQRREYMLVHNQTTMNSGWDFDLLTDELDGLDFDGFDFGFDIDDEEQREVVEDDYDAEPPVEPKAKLGDIYQLGRHRLMCGDSTKAKDVEKLMDGQKADLLLTDPPYGIDVVQNSKIGGDKPFGSVGGNNIVKANEYMPIIGDETTDTARANFEITSGLIDNQIIFGGNYFTDFLPPKSCWIVWDKQNTGNFADVELAWTSFDKAAKLYKWLWNGLCREGDRKTEGIKRVHPTQKPVGLIAEILKDFSGDGNIILDCFGGSGSTLIACEQLGRTCYMMELSPQYIDVVIDRWEKFTGEKAKKLN